MRRADDDVTEEELTAGEGEAPTVCPICGRELVETEDIWSNVERCYNPSIPPPGGMTIINYGVMYLGAQVCPTGEGAR